LGYTTPPLATGVVNGDDGVAAAGALFGVVVIDVKTM
jgi:hypothetical protein